MTRTVRDTQTGLRAWFCLAVLGTACLGVANGAAAQIAPRYVVGSGESRTYRDVAGTVACRTDHLSTVCISQSLERLSCNAGSCETTPADEADWLALRGASGELYVHPYTELWSSTYGGSGCIAQQGGGFICQDANGRRRPTPSNIDDLLLGSWAPNCASGDAITYFRDRTLAGNRRFGCWRVEGGLLTETYVVRADPADATDTDMSFTRHSRVTVRDDNTLLMQGEWLSGGDVSADVVLMRCHVASGTAEHL